LQTEIKETNAAIAACHGIANAYLVFKKQIVIGVCENYRAAQSERIRFEALLHAGALPPNAPFSFPINLQSFEAPFAPIAALQKLLEERIIPEGPPLPFLALLTQAISTLNSVLKARNELIEIMRHIPPTKQAERYAVYFGVGMGGSVTDGSYPAHMDALAKLTDDCIGISIVLSEILHAHASQRARQLGQNSPPIAKAEWENPAVREFLPDLTRYIAWIDTAFGKIRR